MAVLSADWHVRQAVEAIRAADYLAATQLVSQFTRLSLLEAME